MKIPESGGTIDHADILHAARCSETCWFVRSTWVYLIRISPPGRGNSAISGSKPRMAIQGSRSRYPSMSGAIRIHRVSIRYLTLHWLGTS